MRILIQSLLLISIVLSGALPAAAECKCLNRGEEVTEGKTACIKTAKGSELALCEKNLNVTNWKFLGEECPTAQAPEDALRDTVKVAQVTH